MMPTPKQCNPCKTKYSAARVQGFTLLELLVVISILSLIMSATFGAVRISNRSFQAGIERANASEQLRLASAFLQRQFTQILPIVTATEAEPVISFLGSRNQLRFIAPSPQFADGAGLFVYTLSVDENPGAQRLMIAYTPYDPGAEHFFGSTAGRMQILAEELSGGDFEFYGAKSEREQPAWHDTWESELAQLPQLVRIRLLTNTAKPEWPVLTFAIRTEARS
jgi:general secretion pathway protein J